MISKDLEFTIPEVEKVSRDVRIKASAEEIKAMCDELNRRLGPILELQKIDTGDLKPLVNPLELQGRTLELRKDAVGSANLQKELMAAAPHAEKDYYIVPSVMDNL